MRTTNKRAIVYGGTGSGSKLEDFSFRGKDPTASLRRRYGLCAEIFEQKETATAWAWGIILTDPDGYPRGKVWIKTLKN